MATTDINGMVFYATSDPVTALATNLNAMSTATTNAFNSTTRTFRVANQAARDALLTSRGASASAPLQVDRADTGNTERNVTGVIGGWTGGAWTAYTPSFVNLTLGNGSVAATYLNDNNTIDFEFRITWGSTTTIVSSNPYVSLPFPVVGSAVNATLGSGLLYDASSGIWYPLLPTNSGANTRICGSGGAFANTFPITLAAGDLISARLRYQIA